MRFVLCIIPTSTLYLYTLPLHSTPLHLTLYTLHQTRRALTRIFYSSPHRLITFSPHRLPSSASATSVAIVPSLLSVAPCVKKSFLSRVKGISPIECPEWTFIEQTNLGKAYIHTFTHSHIHTSVCTDSLFCLFIVSNIIRVSPASNL